ncbi:MAG: inositol phosphorylceramide synthase [Deltaproteobacteria bacterium]|nr:inositol phosphorylceramide synthase [Deltaproteobacteria bacterium]
MTTTARDERRLGVHAWAPLPFAAWAVFMLVRRELRIDHVALLMVVSLLAFAAPWTRRLLSGLYPIALVALVYDSMRVITSPLTADRVHLCDLHALEARLFGWSEGGAVRTVHDWLQPRAHLALDVYFAIPYGTFIFATIAFAAWLFKKDQPAFRRFGWMFLVLNVAGFVTYRLIPAAPPWYFHLRGCAVDPLQPASAGPNLTRVDGLLGFPYFASMYARSTNVFGAVPSLHVTYPLLVVLEGRTVLGRAMRAATIVYFASMCVAAVYLDHHWVIDVVLGVAYAVAARALVRSVAARWEQAAT